MNSIKLSPTHLRQLNVAVLTPSVRSSVQSLSSTSLIKRSQETVTDGTSPLTKKSLSVPVRALFGGGSAATKNAPNSLYDITAKTIDGKPMSMSDLRGKVVLFVNVASACGFTPQYMDLNYLYDKYKSQGFEIVAQPCNQFGGQEPGSSDAIKSFASKKGAEFPLLEKADVNGEDQTDLFAFLKSKSGGLFGSDVKWNFEKFLVDRSGNVVKRYGSITNPKSIEGDIKALL